jgi:hypothetical protein
MADAAVLGRFLWHELLTTDCDAAIAFYSKVVGWGTQPFGDTAMPYTLWTAASGPAGGMMKLPPEVAAQGAPPHWLGYVGTPDVEVTTRRAVELGGQIHHPPTDIPEVGKFAVLSDPQNAIFCAFTPASEASGPVSEAKVGEFSWHELATTDWEAAIAFYADLFGWVKREAMVMGPLGTYLLFGLPDGPTLGGIYNQPKDMCAPPHWLYYALVHDIQAATASIGSSGGQVLMGPHEVPGGDWIVVGRDPQGGAFALHAKKK